MPSRLEDRNGWRRERRIGECADRNSNHVWRVRTGEEDRRAAVGAEMKGQVLAAFVRRSDEVAGTTDDMHVIRHERRLDRESAPGPPLAGKAVAHGDPDRISLRC